MIVEVQTRIRRCVRRLFGQRGRLESDAAQALLAWKQSGGFSVDTSVRIEGLDRPGRERYARPPLALERLEGLDKPHLLYHLSKPTPDGGTRAHLTPLERIGRLAALIDDAELPPPTHSDASDPPEDRNRLRSPARSLGARLWARREEVFPLACPVCGSPMTIIRVVRK